jgi:transcriptional regulator with XRE-family HTH domain
MSATTFTGMEINAKIRHLIRSRGMSQAELEVAAALPRNRVAKWMSGQGEPTARQAGRIAGVLGVPVAYLVDDRQDEPPIDATRPELDALLSLVQALGIDEARRRLLWPSPANPGVHTEGGAKAYPVGGQRAEVPGESPPNRKRG